ncbi:PDDEXK family nuclease [Rubrobacter marinus]|uniref:hypothetical protein n=1 Tax=Rubrobacter marinus TaxID=2653852 RepID=UPI001A9F60B9|nr:hypothetical protein [Rubrobacter marinus]
MEGEVAPSRFKDWTVGGRTGREEHIEELLVRHPGLLNFETFDLGMSSNDEVLIVSQQPIASNRKRADLLGVHRDGSLVVIEIKRDAEDASHRTESLEFQALRYAAASRKMTASEVIGLFKNHLRKKEASEETGELGDSYWRALAVKRLGSHLVEEDEEMTEEDLASIIDPRKKQKIYLVAASYEGDATAACAWLREHGIDISAFRLRPYVIAGEPVLERERLIPPPELDEFMSETFAAVQAPETPTTASTARKPIIKPSELTWSDREEPVYVASWRALLQHVITRALSEGMPPEQLPLRWAHDDKSGMIASAWIETQNSSVEGQDRHEHSGMFVDLHGSSEFIRGTVNTILQRWNTPVELTVETVNGDTYEFPLSP